MLLTKAYSKRMLTMNTNSKPKFLAVDVTLSHVGAYWNPTVLLIDLANNRNAGLAAPALFMRDSDSISEKYVPVTEAQIRGMQ